MARQIIVTGFRAFPGVEDNPSQRVVERLERAPRLLPHGSAIRLLDVTYASVDAALDEIFRTSPAVLVLTGFSREARGLTLETRVTTAFAPDRPDCDGAIPSCPSGGVRQRDNDAVDFALLETALTQAGLACSRSADAGAYLCNFIYRRALEQIEERGIAARAIFVHLPAIAGTPLALESRASMDLEEMARGVALVARQLAGD